MTPRRRTMSTVLALLTVVAACGGDDDAEPDAEPPDTKVETEAYGAQVASYDLAADAPQRFLVGLLVNEGGLVVGGEVNLTFTYTGPEPAPPGTGAVTTTTASDIDPDDVDAIEDVTATFIPVADGKPATSGPKLRTGDAGAGAYEATGVEFPEAGIWEVTVEGEVDGNPFEIEAAFDVHETAAIPTEGDPAPRTVNLLPGDPEAPAKAVDSRAEDDGSVPDPQLHSLTVADAIATGKPTVVVISTPVFCVSRFCGPITDTVAGIADEYGDRANFVHIEVWRDFENKNLNRGAAEWIYPNPSTDAAEPWVFLVDGQGTITKRWDNIANGGAIRSALDALL